MHNISGNNGPIGIEGAALLSSAPNSGGTAAAATAYGMTPEQASREFDSLRREATKLERLLEDKVARYQQVCVFACVFSSID